MKIISKRDVFFLIIGIIIAGSIGVFAYSYKASDISYTPKDKDWNVKTVQEAITDLYENKTDPTLVYSYYPESYNDYQLSKSVNLESGKYLLIINMSNSEGFNNILNVNVENATVEKTLVNYNKIVGSTNINVYHAIIDVKEENDVNIILNQNINRGYTLKQFNIYKIADSN